MTPVPVGEYRKQVQGIRIKGANLGSNGRDISNITANQKHIETETCGMEVIECDGEEMKLIILNPQVKLYHLSKSWCNRNFPLPPNVTITGKRQIEPFATVCDTSRWIGKTF
jgi:hypothetical protein